MRKLLPALALVASAVSVPALAADWVFVFPATNFDLYVDRTSIRQVGSFKQAWSRMDLLDQSDDVRAAFHLTEYDCAGRRTRLLQATIYYRNGQPDLVPGEQTFRYATPDSSGEAGLDYVCFGRLPQ